MERAEVLDVMREKATDLLAVEPDRMQEDSTFVDDLGVDSLALVEYTMDLEDALGIELDEEELSGVTTVGQYADVLVRKLSTALNGDG